MGHHFIWALRTLTPSKPHDEWGNFSFFALGMANGFIPCGLVYFFLATATSTQSWFYGGVVMAIFGVVTLVSMLSFSYVVSLLKELFFRDMIIKITAIMVIMYGIYMGYVGFISIKGIS